MLIKYFLYLRYRSFSASINVRHYWKLKENFQVTKSLNLQPLALVEMNFGVRGNNLEQNFSSTCKN